jgi:1-acyl-sn-glycerol-3-phosphate acyltransferase
VPVAGGKKYTPLEFLAGTAYLGWLVFLSPFFTVYGLVLLLVLFLGTFDIHRAARIHNVVFGRTVLFLSWPWVRCRVHGRSHARGLKRVIVTVNHATAVDIFFTALLPFPDRMVFVKNWVTRMFYLGSFVRLARYVDTQSVDSGTYPGMMEEPCNRKTSFQMYPEGTRTKDGKLGRFHSGAFWLSIKTGLPVLPVYMEGLFGFPATNFPFVFPVKADIHILEPVYPALWRESGDHVGMRKAVRRLYDRFTGTADG